MRTTAWMVVLSAMVSTTAMATEVAVPACVMDLRYRNDGPNHDQQGRRPYLNTNQRLVENLGDVSNGTVVTTGFGKCHVKLKTACGDARKFAAVVESGFEWKLVEKTFPGLHFRATVTKITCVPK